MPRARRLAARAPAADLLVQLAARRLPAVHRPRRAAGDRPRPARPRPVALDRRGRAGALGGRQLGLLRVGDPGDRRALGDRPRQALARPDAPSSRTCSCTAPRASGSTSSTATGWAEALVHAQLRGDRPEPAAPLPGDRLGAAARADRGVHVVPPVPGVQGRAPEARGARGHRRRDQHPPVHAVVGDARARSSSTSSS